MTQKLCKNNCGKPVAKDRGGLNKANRRKAKFCSDNCCKDYWKRECTKRSVEERENKKKAGTYKPKSGGHRPKANTDPLQGFLSSK